MSSGNESESKNKCIKFLKYIRSFFYYTGHRERKDVGSREIIESLKYHYKNLHAWTPRLFYLGILRIIPDTLIPIFAILLPTMVVKGLEEKWEAGKFVAFICILMTAMLIVNLVNARIQAVLTSEKDKYRLKYVAMLYDKKMDIDYDILESQEFQNKEKYAVHWVLEWSEPMERCISSIGAIGSCIIGMIIYGTALAMQSVLILIFIGISVMVSVIMMSKALTYENETWKKTTKSRRKMGYINNQAMDFAAEKDIRLFGMQKWFLKMYRSFLKINEKFMNDIQWKYTFKCMVEFIFVFIRDGASYIYLIYEIVKGNLTVSDFVLYTGLVAGFSLWLTKAVEEIQWLSRGGYAFHAIKDCLDVKSKWKNENIREEKDSKAAPDNRDDEIQSIEFKDVYFTYNGCEKPTLAGLNLKISKGEKIALVGLNGAGKTTFVKLLCGFYNPTKGEILVNGIPIRDYDREKYYSMISAVFQDSKILPVSIAQNISADKEELTDEEKVKKCLELSGLDEKISKLDEGEKTLLVRELSADAIDLSGGEKQKLFLSRALYKGGKFLILDEPTAALDPIAENEIYMKYNSLTEGKISIFISHRLASTRFCDRIVLLDKGKIAEEGTHDSLIKLNGEYAHMFEIQSRYYKEESKNNKCSKGGDIEYA